LHRRISHIYRTILLNKVNLWQNHNWTFKIMPSSKHPFVQVATEQKMFAKLPPSPPPLASALNVWDPT
jgi:hypothetical protein